MMKAIYSSETSVFTRARHLKIPEDSILHSHRRENLKSYRKTLVCVRQVSISDWAAIRSQEETWLRSTDRQTRMYEGYKKKCLSSRSFSEKRAGERISYGISLPEPLLLLASPPSFQNGRRRNWIPLRHLRMEALPNWVCLPPAAGTVVYSTDFIIQLRVSRFHCEGLVLSNGKHGASAGQGHFK
jgi:hypothetical protein